MIPDEAPVERGIGDNSGTMLQIARGEQAEALADTLRDGGKTFAQRASEFVLSAERQIVVDRRSAADAADTIKLASELWAMIDADRKARSDPFREVHLALSGMATEFWEPVAKAMQRLREQIDAWTEEEDKRIADRQRAQAEQFAAMRTGRSIVEEVAQKPFDPTRTISVPSAGREFVDYSPDDRLRASNVPAPVAPAMRPARRAKIHGDLGSTISVRENTIYEIEDISLIPDHIMQSRTVTDAILSVVRATAKHMGVPAGIRTLTSTGNQIR